MSLKNKLSELFEIQAKDLQKKLNLKENYNEDDLYKALGLYKVFADKKTYEDSIYKALDNKEKEIKALSDQILKSNEKLSSVINSEWTTIANKPLPELDTDTIDYSNIRKSLLQVANDNNIEIIKQPTQEASKQQDELKHGKVINDIFIY